MSVSITGTGSYLPERVLSNADLEKMVDTSNDWIVTRTGIKERRIARKDETASTMGATAARNALESAGVRPEEIDMILVGTATPDMPFPSTACLVQNAIRAKNAFCMDVGAACSGFLYALETCRKYIDSGQVRTALIIGSEKFSAITDWKDRDTCVLFGDGAGAAVVQPVGTGRGIISTVMGSDGSLSELLAVPGGEGRSPESGETAAGRLPYIKMIGREVFKYAVRYMTEAAQQTLEQGGVSIDDVDWVIPHQANVRIMKAISSRLNVPMDRFYLNLERVGNISAASVPVALDEAVRAGVVKRGDILLFIVFGGGFTWGASVMEW